jgi:hypothetical protein
MFLFGACIIEVTAWGMYSLPYMAGSGSPNLLTSSRLPILLWRFRGILQQPSTIRRSEPGLYRRRAVKWRLAAVLASCHVLCQQFP